jgi:hypothetical protein
LANHTPSCAARKLGHVKPRLHLPNVGHVALWPRDKALDAKPKEIKACLPLPGPKFFDHPPHIRNGLIADWEPMGEVTADGRDIDGPNGKLLYFTVNLSPSRAAAGASQGTQCNFFEDDSCA